MLTVNKEPVSHAPPRLEALGYHARTSPHVVSSGKSRRLEHLSIAMSERYQARQQPGTQNDVKLLKYGNFSQVSLHPRRNLTFTHTTPIKRQATEMID